MELRHLRYAIVVAEELHFSRAAARLNISQPPLSQQIKQIEDELGVELFRRTKRSVKLTPAGEVFIAEARSLLRQLDRVAKVTVEASRGEVGNLLVGTVTTTDNAFYRVLVDPFTSVRGALSKRPSCLADLERHPTNPGSEGRPPGYRICHTACGRSGFSRSARLQ